MKTFATHMPRRRFLGLAGGAALALGALPLIARAAEATGGPGDARMRIGIIGSGHVGSAIGSAWARAGHEVMFSSRNLEHDEQLAIEVGRGARAGTPREAAAFGDVVVVSVPYRALPDVGKALADLIRDKVVIDTCNPFVGRDGEIASWAREKGAGLASAELLPGARIVRAFNAVSAARMGAAHREPGRFGMPIAGDDPDAIAVASQLVRDVGYEPVVIGGLAMGRHLVPGTALAGEHPPEEIRQIAAGL